MERPKLWKAFFMILSALLGFGAGEILDDKIDTPFEAPAAECIIPSCGEIVIAYTDQGKYFCECVGPECECKSTEEILSELG